MSDTEQQAAGADYIAIIKAAKEHGVLHLKIGSFEITMQVAPRDSLSSLSQPYHKPLFSPPIGPAVNYEATSTTTSTAEAAKPARGTYASKLDKLHQKRQQFDDFRNLKPPSKDDDTPSSEN